MRIDGKNYIVEDSFDKCIFLPDCWVSQPNKIGEGHGEKKLYIANKDEMRAFYGAEGFRANCFLLKEDLIRFMNTVRVEYQNPSQTYIRWERLKGLWQERFDAINGLDDIIWFTVADQMQIAGPRGYVNSDDTAYQLIRELALPLISYISVMRLSDNQHRTVFYWKLFVDFDAIEDKQNALVYTYGRGHEEQPQPEVTPEQKKRDSEISRARVGQGQYREELLLECPFCPITLINDERLLIASHIKPWAVSSDKEKIDPKNGFMLSPLYDKLFDRGFITFTPDRKVHISDWLSPANKNRIGITEGQFIQRLPIDEYRINYLSYHRESVFKG